MTCTNPDRRGEEGGGKGEKKERKLKYLIDCKVVKHTPPNEQRNPVMYVHSFKDAYTNNNRISYRKLIVNYLQSRVKETDLRLSTVVIII